MLAFPSSPENLATEFPKSAWSFALSTATQQSSARTKRCVWMASIPRKPFTRKGLCSFWARTPKNSPWEWLRVNPFAWFSTSQTQRAITKIAITVPWAYVYFDDDTMLNAELIRQGYAPAYTRFPFRHLVEFRELESMARSQAVGFWRAASWIHLKRPEVNKKQCRWSCEPLW